MPPPRTGVLVRASWLVGALAQVGGHDGVEALLGLAAAADPLVALLDSAVPAVAEAAAFALGSIAEAEAAVLDLTDAGDAALAPLLRLLGSDTPGAVEQAARCLRFMAAASFTWQRAIYDAGAAPLLAGLLSHASHEVVIQAAGAIAALAHTNTKQVCLDVAAAGGVQALIRLLQGGDVRVMEAVSDALCVLVCMAGQLRTEAAEAGAVPLLAGVLADATRPRDAPNAPASRPDTDDLVTPRPTEGAAAAAPAAATPATPMAAETHVAPAASGGAPPGVPPLALHALQGQGHGRRRKVVAARRSPGSGRSSARGARQPAGGTEPSGTPYGADGEQRSGDGSLAGSTAESDEAAAPGGTDPNTLTPQFSASSDASKLVSGALAEGPAHVSARSAGAGSAPSLGSPHTPLSPTVAAMLRSPGIQAAGQLERPQSLCISSDEFEEQSGAPGLLLLQL